MRRLSGTALTAIADFVLTAAGSAPAEAALVARHLVDANLAGHDSHGVGMLPDYLDNVAEGTLRPNTPARLLEDGGAVLRFAGDRGYGQRVAREAMQQAVARAGDLGLVALTLANAHHIGRVGTYGEMALDAKLVMIAFANVSDREPLVAAEGGRFSKLGTNPIVIAFPGTGGRPPFLLDMATSQIAFGKVRVAAAEGRELPDGCILDEAGEASRDPAPMAAGRAGALLPLGSPLAGHKGYGLALAAELLASLMGGGGTMAPPDPREGGIINSFFAVLLDPARFGGLESMAEGYGAILDYVTDGHAPDPEAPVKIAGDPERASRERRGREGIPLAEETWRLISETAERRFGVSTAALEALAAT